MKHLLTLALSLTLLFALPTVMLVGPGCGTTARTVVYNTLAATAATVDHALKLYADVVVKGQAAQALQVKIVAAKARYEMGMKLAIEAARGDLSKLTPAQVQALADELTALITLALKK